jgi:lysophospholipase L1-like esterase
MSSKVDDIRKIECDALYKGDVEGKVHAYNGAIRNLVDRYEAVAGGRLFLVEGVADLPIAREHLSFDGFHPSMDGQVTFGEAFERALQQIP